MTDYKEIRKFKSNGNDMVVVEMQSTGSCCIMTEDEYDRLLIGDLANRKKGRRSKNR